MALAAVDPTIVLYLPFEEQSGKVAKDLSQFGHKAEFRKKTAWSKDGKRGGCIELGIGNWLEVKDHNSLDLTNKMTIMFWSKHNLDVSPKDKVSTTWAFLKKAILH